MPAFDLSCPAEPGHLRLVRQAVAATAGLAGFTVDEVDDLVSAVEEAAAVAVTGLDGPTSEPVTELDGPTLELRARELDGTLVVEGSVHLDEGAPAAEVHELVELLLAGTAAAFELVPGPGGRRFKVVGRRDD